MNAFLKQVVNYLFVNHRDQLSEYCLIFPGRRAGVFFTAYMNELVDHPILSPEIITISELISSLTDLQEADHVSLILKLQDVYSKETGHDEPLDEFFFWGEILLTDFDDIDKYLLNADDLFRNISDLKELENQFDYLTEEQKKAIDEFWGNLDKVPHSFNKEKFITIWVKLASIYKRFRDQLRCDQMAYSGMIYREVAEHFEKHLPTLTAKKYLFIGFNALNACEKSIFRKLDKLQRAMFFWDFGDYYLNDAENEAGHFLRTNMVLFPHPKDFEPEEEPVKERKVKLVAVPGNITQAQAINLPQILKDLSGSDRFDHTAFVLADENLLTPVVSAVGKNFANINITMGYPFVNTPVYGFISQLISLQKSVRKSSGKAVFYYKPVLAILNHQFVVTPGTREFIVEITRKNRVYLSTKELGITDFLKKVFATPESWQDILDYFIEVLRELSVRFVNSAGDELKLEAEYLFQAFLSIQRLRDTLSGLNVPEFPVKIMFRLLDQSLRRISVPFEGEPLKGLQIMGLLETRCLDFENLVLFSANEGFIPRISAGQSFVPYHLRKGFGMPTYEDRDAMYAYYFYRLLHRAKNPVIVFNSVTEGVSSSERSRFLYQLQYDSDFDVEEVNLSFNFKGTSSNAIQIQSANTHFQKLVSIYSQRNLSPSAINTYIDCKLKFYFKYLAGIKESEELKEEIDAVLFGNLFHYVMELLYTPFVGKMVELQALKLLRADKRMIEEAVKLAIGLKYYQMDREEAGKISLSGQSVLIASHIRDYIYQLLENDMRIAPFRVLSLEKEYAVEYQVPINNGNSVNIRIGGIVDRVDQTSEGLRVVDYKTGRNIRLDFKEWEQLTNPDAGDRRKEIFQLLIYADILSKIEYQHVLPAIYRLDNLFDDDFNPNVIYQSRNLEYSEVHAEFQTVLLGVLSEIFDQNTVYMQTSDIQKCTYCSFNKICRR